MADETNTTTGNADTVIANVDASKVDAEVAKVSAEKLAADKAEFEKQKAEWEKERASFEPPKPRIENFDIDDALDDPFRYFGERGIDEEKAFQLAQAVFFEKHKDKKPSDYDLKKTQRKSERALRKLEEKTANLEKEAEAKAEAKRLEEYNKKVYQEFDTAADAIDFSKRDADDFESDYPQSAGFFDDKQDYLQALFSFARQTAEKLKRIPTTKEVQDDLEKWLDQRFSRVKSKRKVTEQLEKKVDGSSTLSLKDNKVPRDKPLTAEERFARAMAAAESKSIVKNEEKK